MSEVVRESGMDFILDESATFYFEKSQTISGISGLKKAEFAVKINSSEHTIIRIIEAKTTAPCTLDGSENLRNYLHCISDKFRDSIIALNVALIKRNKDIYKELPISFVGMNLETLKFQLYLVVRNHKKEWLPSLNDVLKREVRSLMKCWNILDVDVKAFNEEVARQKNIVR